MSRQRVVYVQSLAGPLTAGCRESHGQRALRQKFLQRTGPRGVSGLVSEGVVQTVQFGNVREEFGAGVALDGEDGEALSFQRLQRGSGVWAAVGDTKRP